MRGGMEANHLFLILSLSLLSPLIFISSYSFFETIKSQFIISKNLFVVCHERFRI